MEGIEIRWTPFALRCLDEIHFYISTEAGSPRPATRFVAELFDRVEQLQRYPESGPIEPVLEKRKLACRYLVHGNYKIIYEYLINQHLVVILDVFQTKQNPTELLKNK